MKSTIGGPVLFLLGDDYHLGDLLWLTAVLREFRRRRGPSALILGCPNKPFCAILEGNPDIDRLFPGRPGTVLRMIRAEHGAALEVHDLRPLPLALRMIREWPRRRPWLYLWDLWMEPRGQWLATLLALGRLTDLRPELVVSDEDRMAASHILEIPASEEAHGPNASTGTAHRPYVLLAPRTGAYRSGLIQAFWRRVKSWDEEAWQGLARLLTEEGYRVISLTAGGQASVEGTEAVAGRPIREVAALIEGAAALVTIESGLWFIAAAVGTPFVVVPWWLPKRVDWPAPMGVSCRLVHDRHAPAEKVMAAVAEIAQEDVTAGFVGGSAPSTEAVVFG